MFFGRVAGAVAQLAFASALFQATLGGVPNWFQKLVIR